MHRRKSLIAAAIMMCVVTTAALSSSRVRGGLTALTGFDGPTRAEPPGRQGSPRGGPGYVRRASLHPMQREMLNVLGDRLERPGQERSVMVGTLTRDGRTPSPVRIVRESPGRLRVEEQSGPVTVFDGSHAQRTDGPVSDSERDLIETLAHDTAEHYFSLLMSGRGARFLGGRFRLDSGADSSPDATVYDIYQLGDEIGFGGAPARRLKLFYFNSETLLLERVRYEVERDGANVRVEVLLTDWRSSQGQQFPRRVVRTENGSPVFTLTLNAVTPEPRAADRTFHVSQP